MNSSDWLLQREALKKKIDEDGGGALSRENRNSLRQFLSQMLLTVLKFLATWISWIRGLNGFGKFIKLAEKQPKFSSEKADFLVKYGDEYGFPEGPMSVDELRSKEFARLEGKVYLDHAGATLYTETQLKATLADLSVHLYGNPHSQNESSTFSSDAVESTRNQVLAMCKASPEEYTCVFTSGATAALKLVGEAFPWSRNSQYMYTMENHNSVLGIREYALNQGATVTPVDIDHNAIRLNGGGGASKFDSSHFRQRSPQRRTIIMHDQDIPDEQVYNLFACPLECNFSGAKVDLGLISFVQQAQHTNTQRGQWLVLLDAAKGCSTSPPNLSNFPADFVALSFYKIFGYPTGLGALIIRKDAAKLLKKSYFGGGTVAVSIADADFVQRRQKIEQWLEDGTVSFLNIAALRHGFHVIDQLQMSAIERHTGSLASYTASKLTGFKHSNGHRLCVLYGNHNLLGRTSVRYWGSHCEQGPIVAFNMKRADGSWIGSREVEKLATLSGIHLRTGCFCNPGACAKYLGLSINEMKANFEAGHVCWDDKDLINGCPVGAVRVSVGYMTTFEDCWAFVQFIAKFFLEHDPIINPSYKEKMEGCLLTSALASSDRNAVTEEVVSLQSIIVYPIKSCAGFKTNSWPLGDCGLLYDREWLIMSTSGEVLTQKKCPLMCFVQTYIDLESGILHVQAPQMKSGLDIPLMEVTDCKLSGDVWLCGDLVGAHESGRDFGDWFTEALGIPCRLVRREAKIRPPGKSISEGVDGDTPTRREEQGLSFANEGQFLLVSQESVEDLNLRLICSSSEPDEQDQTSTSGKARIQVDATRFRPNFVVSGSIPYDEDNWQALTIGDHQFKVMGSCNRCKMINIDQITGKSQVSSEPLVTLASYRRVKGRIYFGILLEQETGRVQFSSELTRLGRDQDLDEEGTRDSFLRRKYGRLLEVGDTVQVQRGKESC